MNKVSQWIVIAEAEAGAETGSKSPCTKKKKKKIWVKVAPKKKAAS